MLGSAMPLHFILVTIAALGGLQELSQAADPLAHVRQVYVEPFSGKAGAVQFREGVIAQLRKLASITVVSDKSAADAVLSGNGDIYVKGYRSLNPRSGRSPSNGTPVYGGYLSLELTDAKGEPLWSYLETSSGSEEIAKDLSKKIVKRLGDAIASAGARL